MLAITGIIQACMRIKGNYSCSITSKDHAPNSRLFTLESLRKGVIDDAVKAVLNAACAEISKSYTA